MPNTPNTAIDTDTFAAVQRTESKNRRSAPDRAEPNHNLRFERRLTRSLGRHSPIMRICRGSYSLPVRVTFPPAGRTFQGADVKCGVVEEGFLQSTDGGTANSTSCDRVCVNVADESRGIVDRAPLESHLRV